MDRHQTIQRIEFQHRLTFYDLRWRAHVDALAARMITHPETLDVVVASNLFADILTDLGAALAVGRRVLGQRRDGMDAGAYRDTGGKHIDPMGARPPGIEEEPGAGGPEQGFPPAVRHEELAQREDPMDALVFYNQLRKAGVGLITCCEGRIDLEDFGKYKS